MFERMSASLDSIFTYSHRGLSVVVANNMDKDECLREYGLHVWHLVIFMSGIMMYTGMSTCYALNGRGMKYTLKTRPKNMRHICCRHCLWRKIFMWSNFVPRDRIASNVKQFCHVGHGQIVP